MAAKDPPITVPVPSPAATLRLTFAYRDRDVRLLASRRVAMIPPPPVTPAPVRGQSGYWFELHDVTGALLFHRALSSVIRSDVEAFSDDVGQTMIRLPVPAPEGQFEVLVPDLPDGKTFLLFGAPTGATSESAPSVELFGAEMDELRKPRGDAPAPDPGTTPGGSGRK